MWHAESGQSAWVVQPMQLFVSASHRGVVPVHAAVAVAVHCTQAESTHTGVSGNLLSHAAFGSATASQAEHTEATQNGASASVHSSSLLHPAVPSSLEEPGPSVVSVVGLDVSAPVSVPVSVPVSGAVVSPPTPVESSSGGASSATLVGDSVAPPVLASVSPDGESSPVQASASAGRRRKQKAWRVGAVCRIGK